MSRDIQCQKCVSKAKEKALECLVLHTFNFQDLALILQEHLTNFKTEEIGGMDFCSVLGKSHLGGKRDFEI